MTECLLPARLSALVVSALLCWPLTTLANDGYAEFGLGGVISLGKTFEVSMRKEVLTVSPDKIRVEYAFVKQTAGALTLPVIFPLPLYSAEQPSWAWSGAPLDFSVKVHGRLLPFTTVVKARGRCAEGLAPTRECGPDITARLKAVGLSDQQLADYPLASPFVDKNGQSLHAAPLSAEQTRTLLAQGDLAEQGPSNERPYPLWLADVSYLWQMAFKDAKPLHVVHEYRPFTSGGSNSFAFTEDMLRNDYCASDALIAAWKKLVAAAKPFGDNAYGPVPGRRVEYILTTANSWAGPIEDFTLRLKKEKPDELVALCFPGKRQMPDPLTLEIQLKNFAPKQELRVLFLNIEHASAPGNSAGVAPSLSH